MKRVSLPLWLISTALYVFMYAPLAVAYPRADMPVVQLSLKAGLDPQDHLPAQLGFIQPLVLAGLELEFGRGGFGRGGGDFAGAL